jgi:hypothetical protein
VQAPCDVDICVLLDIEIDQGVVSREARRVRGKRSVCREPFYPHQARRAASVAFKFIDRLLCLFGIVKHSPDVIDKKLVRRRNAKGYPRTNVGFWFQDVAVDLSGSDIAPL